MSIDYILTVPETSTLRGPSYCPWGQSSSNILIADNTLYGRMRDLSTESASWQTRYIVPDIRQEFDGLVKKWKRETINLSSIQEIILHPAYQRIIGMGPDVIPLILNHLERCPDFLFWALRSLTGENPVTRDMRGDIEAMTEAWLNWGRKNGFI